MQVVHDLRDDMKSRLPDRGPLDDLIERFQHGNAAAEEARQPRDFDRRPYQRRGAVVVYHLRRLPGGVPGVHRPPSKILEDAAQSGAAAGKRYPAIWWRTFKNLEQNGNPWGLGADRRMDWAEATMCPRSTRSRMPNGCCG